MRVRGSTCALVISSLLLSAACSRQGHPPLTVSSAGEPTYAARYPDGLTIQRGWFAEYETSVQSSLEEMQGYPDALEGADPEIVLEIVTAADAAGRSSAYAARFAEAERIDRFFHEEKGEVGKQLAGSVRYAVKQKGAGEEVVDAAGSAAVYGLERAVAKRLEERTRALNEAHRSLEEHEEALGKANVEKLRNQIDTISRASYLVHVGMIELRRDLEARVAEGSEVRATLDRNIDELRARAEDTARTDKQRALAQKRLAVVQAARERLDAELEGAEAGLAEMEQRERQLQEDYSKALDELKRRLRERADSSTPQ